MALYYVKKAIINRKTIKKYIPNQYIKEEVIQEMLLTTTSERQGRVIDHDQAASMEKKKQEGYF